MMDDVDALERHFASSLVARDRDVMDVRAMTIEARQLAVTLVMDRVDDRHAGHEPRAGERHGGVRVHDVERAVFDDLLHGPRDVVQIGEHLRRPLRLRVEGAELRAGRRVSGSEQYDVVAALDEPFHQLVYDELSAAVRMRWHRHERRGYQCDAHVAGCEKPSTAGATVGPGGGYDHHRTTHA